MCNSRICCNEASPGASLIKHLALAFLGNAITSRIESVLASNATNPGGGSAGGTDEKSTAEKIAEKMFGGKKQENNIISHYVGGN